MYCKFFYSGYTHLLSTQCFIQLTSLCRSDRDPEKYFDIGMVRDNQLGIMGRETLWQNISFKKNAYLQASFYTIPLLTLLQNIKVCYRRLCRNIYDNSLP